MTPRDPDEDHRVATPLELFFDLTFVVGVAQASSSTHHELISGHAADALVAYPIVFFAVWWAWMNFTWFGSAYDTDDALYRLAVFVQMAGVLTFAAGIPRFLEDIGPSIAVVGYVIMRVGLVGQWLRVAASHPEGRASALRYAAGILGCQAGWVVLALVADGGWWLAFAAPLALAELAVPVWAERYGPTPWHPSHIGERYGLFTIIVLGESVLAATVAIQIALDEGIAFSDLLTIAVGGFLTVVSMWWVYFDQPIEEVLTRARAAFSHEDRRHSFIWGYGHYSVFASAAAVGVGLAVAVDQVIGDSTLSDRGAAFTFTGPVAMYVLTVWALHRRFKAPGALRRYAAPVTAALVLAASWTAEPVLFTGLVLAGLIGALVVITGRASATPA